METSYSIVDIDGFAQTIRMGAANAIDDTCDKKDLDSYITINQIKNLLSQEYNLGKDNEGYYIISEDLFDQMFECVREIIYGVALAKLAAQNLIQCYWDSTNDKMYFHS